MLNLKSISPILAVGAMIGLVAYLCWRIDKLKDDRLARDRQIQDLEWKLSLSRADLDSIKGLGQYSKPETLWRTRTVTRIDTVSGQVDTVYENIPDIRGEINFDTTKQFGPLANPLSVRVYGRFYYPEEFSHLNRLLIVPAFTETPYKPQGAPIRGSCGIGLACAFPLDSAPYPGFVVRYKRLSLFGLKLIRRRGWMAAGSLEILRF